MAQATDGKPIKTEELSNSKPVTPTAHSATTTTTSSTPSRRRHLQRQSWSGWAVNNILRCAFPFIITSISLTHFRRLTVWYSLLTVIFRCPSESSSLEATHPQICRPYLTVRSYAQPYVQPYYDTYAEPYVSKARPYLEQAQSRVIAPASAVASKNYQTYAEPQVQKAKTYLWTQWGRAAVPHLKVAQDKAQQLYDQNLAPHVETLSNVAGPYYESLRDNAVQTHENHIVPAIAFSQPHVQSAFTASQKFVRETAWPTLYHAWTRLIIFLDGTAMPFMKALYTNNVKPQLVMIGERIAKYQQSAKLQAAIDEVDPVVDQSTTIVDTSTTTDATSTVLETSSVSSASSTPSIEPKVATDETVAEDLIKWQKKFAIAADKGSDDLKERVRSIIQGMVNSEISEGEGLSNALEKTTTVEIDGVKAKINAVAGALPENAARSDVAAAEEEVVQAIRGAGSKVKARAKQVRAWSDGFKQDLHQRINLAAESTLQVLDNIRDLGLQEIGMRWAWMDGITYNHWQKYHNLKQRFDEWRLEVREVAVDHPSYHEAQENADRVLEEAMSITETAAKELIRLKDVAKWKINARDTTDDFDSRAVPVAAAAVSAASSLAAEMVGMTSILVPTIDLSASEEPGYTESSESNVAQSVLSGASGAAADLLSSVASMAGGSDVSAGSLTAQASSVASSASESASSAIFGTTETLEYAAAAMSSVASQVAAQGEEVASSASSVLLGTTPDTGEALLSSMNSVYDAVSDTATSLLSSATAPPSEGLLSTASSFADVVSSSASDYASKVIHNKASESVQSVVDQAGSKYEEVTESLASEYA